MIDWKRGGFAGSIRKLARREASAHLRDSPDARRVRYSLPHRIVRRFFNIRNFTSFVCIYVLVDLTFLGAEALFEAFVPSSLSPWSALDTLPSIKLDTLLLSVSGYFLAAQAGALGVITLALALVTLIAQRQTSATDIALYYHESMAFQIVASSVALLAILAAQLLWPLQLLLHRLSLGSQHFIFEFGLLGIHLAWLLMNLAAIAYFIDTTFRFVQQSKRELLRERYTANIVFPPDLNRRLCGYLYVQANSAVGEVGKDGHYDQPSAAFGFDTDQSTETELASKFARATSLQDVRMIWVCWVFQRWKARCLKVQSNVEIASFQVSDLGPKIWFTPHMFVPLQGSVSWCQRQGGVPLTTFEKVVLRHAFVFRGVRDEN